MEEEKNEVIKEKKKIQISLVLAICLIILFLFIMISGAIIGVIFINKKHDEKLVEQAKEAKKQWEQVMENEEKLTTSINEMKESSDEDIKEELDVENEIVKQAYSFIPSVRYNEFLPTAYQTCKITFNDLPNKVKLINVFNKIDFNKENVEIIEGDSNTNNVLENWFLFDAEIIHKYAKSIYGENVKLKDESFERFYAQSCTYENGKYKYTYGGAGSLLEPITYITKAYIEDEKLYIYDKFMVIEEFEKENSIYEYNIYNTTVSEPVYNIPMDELSGLELEEIKKYCIEEYGNCMNEYKHTFEKNEDGNYYWVSTELMKNVDSKTENSNEYVGTWNSAIIYQNGEEVSLTSYFGTGYLSVGSKLILKEDGTFENWIQPIQSNEVSNTGTWTYCQDYKYSDKSGQGILLDYEDDKQEFLMLWESEEATTILVYDANEDTSIHLMK